MKYIIALALIIGLVACDTSTKKVSNQEVFDTMWAYVDENYIYFDIKGINWDEVKRRYAPMVTEDISEESLFEICDNMLRELQDGHNSITNSAGERSTFNVRDGYSVLFDLEMVKAEYLNNRFEEAANFTYGTIQDSIGYCHLSQFYSIHRIATVMNYMDGQDIRGMIMDLRSNSGGAGQDAVDIVNYLVEDSRPVGYIIEKTGPNREDISPPLSINTVSQTPFLDIPVVVLINRGSYSATSYLTGMLKDLPNVTLIGQVTGGGGGGNNTYELPNGWLVTVSINKYIDVNQVDIEAGIQPDLFVENDSSSFNNNRDIMLEKALSEF